MASELCYLGYGELSLIDFIGDYFSYEEQVEESAQQGEIPEAEEE